MNDPTAPRSGPESEAGEHRDTGLDLARSIARSLARRTVPRARGASPRPDPRASGAHPDDRDPQTLDATLGRLVAEQGWATDVRVNGVLARWDAIVGRDVAQHVRPVSYAANHDAPGGLLVVQTDSTAWATQMRLLAATVVRRLNQELGDGTVTFIDVRGPSAPSWKHGRRSLRDGRGPRDTYG